MFKTYIRRDIFIVIQCGAQNLKMSLNGNSFSDNLINASNIAIL